MKRGISLILIVVFASLVACGDTVKRPSNNASNNSNNASNNSNNASNNSNNASNNSNNASNNSNNASNNSNNVSDRAIMVTVSGAGSGSVVSEPAGIDCPNVCSQSVSVGTDVTLTATPDEGSEFVSWSGDCSGASPTVTLPVEVAVTCDAEFAISVAPMALFSLGSNGEHYFRNMLTLNDGSSIVVGWSTVYGAGGDEAIYAHIGKDGTILWAKSIGGPGDDRLYDVVETDNGFMSVGSTKEPTESRPHGWVVQFDEQGNLLSQAKFAFGRFQSVLRTGTNEFSVAGSYFGSDSILAKFDMNNTPGFQIEVIKPTSGFIDMCPRPQGGLIGITSYDVVAFAADGSVDWIGPRIDTPNQDVIVLKEVVETQGGFMLVGRMGRSGYLEHRAWVAKVTDDGAITWQRSFGANNVRSQASGVLELDDGRFLALGSTPVQTHEVAWIIELSANGSPLGNYAYGGSNSQFLRRATIAPDNTIRMIGGTSRPSGGQFGVGMFGIAQVEDLASSCLATEQPPSSTETPRVNIAPEESPSVRPISLTAKPFTPTVGDIVLATDDRCVP